MLHYWFFFSVDAHFRTTAASNVYAVGDVIGPPGLASAAQHQASQLVERLFGSGGFLGSSDVASGADDGDEDEEGEDGLQGGGEYDYFFSPGESFEAQVDDDSEAANLFGSKV